MLEMTAQRPLVLLDPHPRDSATILHAADRERLERIAELVTVESGPVPDSVVGPAHAETSAAASGIVGITDALQRS